MNKHTNRPGLVLAMMTITSLLTSYAASSVYVILPALSLDLRMSAVTTSWVATSFLLASAVCMIPFGRISDMIGRKKIFTGGLAVYTLSSLIACLSPDASWILVSRVLNGMGAAMIFSTSIAILISVYPASERGRVIGINTAAIYIGLSIGPFLSGFLTTSFGWRSSFLVSAGLSLILIPLFLFNIRGEWREAHGEKFDLPGTILYALVLGALLFGFSHLPAIDGWVYIAISLLFLTLFIWWEQKTTSPVVDVRLFAHNRVFALSNLSALVNYSATASISFFLSIYLQIVKSFTAREAGLIILFMPLFQAIFSPMAGRFADKTHPARLASGGMLLTITGLVILSTLGPNSPVALIISTLCLLGVGFALFSSPNTTMIMNSVEKKHLGIASASVGTMRTIGQMMSLSISMLLFSVFIGKAVVNREAAEPFLKALQLGFRIFAMLCMLGLLASLGRGKRKEVVH